MFVATLEGSWVHCSIGSSSKSRKSSLLMLFRKMDGERICLLLVALLHKFMLKAFYLNKE